MYYFYVYGFMSDDILSQKAIVENCLGLSLNEKNSEYYDSAYSYRNEEDEYFILQKNFDGDGFVEEGYKSYPLILKATIKGHESADKLKEKLLSQGGSILIKSRRLSI